MHPATYRIRIDGTVPDERLHELGGMRRVECSPTSTLLEGTLPHQPALLGTILLLEEMGCRVRDLYVVWPGSRASVLA